MTEETRLSRGEVFRVATNALAYLALDDQKTILSFTPSHVKNSNHKDFIELKITEGSIFKVCWRPATEQIQFAEYVAGQDVTEEKLASSADDEGSYANLPHPDIAQSQEDAQVVLHPNAAEKGRTVLLRAINPAVRTFGKLVDTSQLRPGDLMLSQDLEADPTSNLIANVQVEGGYAAADAKWTSRSYVSWRWRKRC